MVAIPLALLSGFVGACVGQFFAWTTAHSLPPVASVVSIGDTLMRTAPAAIAHDDHLFGYPSRFTDSDSLLVAVAGGEDYGPGGVRLTYRTGPATAGFAELSDSWPDGLRAAGWQVSADGSDGSPLLARREGLALEVVVTDGAETELRIGRLQPASTPWWIAAGALIGALVGWLVGCRAGRWLSECSVAARVGAMVALSICAVLLLPGILLTLVGLLPYLLSGHPEQPLWAAFTLPVVRLLTNVAAALGPAALVLAFLGSRRSRRHSAQG